MNFDSVQGILRDWRHGIYLGKSPFSKLEGQDGFQKEVMCSKRLE